MYKGLGPTVPELGLVEANIKPYAKTCFSMCAVPGKYLGFSLTPKGDWVSESTSLWLKSPKRGHQITYLSIFSFKYTVGINVWGGSFLAVNHHNHKNWVPSVLTHKLWVSLNMTIVWTPNIPTQFYNMTLFKKSLIFKTWWKNSKRRALMSNLWFYVE